MGTGVVDSHIDKSTLKKKKKKDSPIYSSAVDFVWGRGIHPGFGVLPAPLLPAKHMKEEYLCSWFLHNLRPGPWLAALTRSVGGPSLKVYRLKCGRGGLLPKERGKGDWIIDWGGSYIGGANELFLIASRTMLPSPLGGADWTSLIVINKLPTQGGLRGWYSAASVHLLTNLISIIESCFWRERDWPNPDEA